MWSRKDDTNHGSHVIEGEAIITRGIILDKVFLLIETNTLIMEMHLNTF
jgi:hypothetical protein